MTEGQELAIEQLYNIEASSAWAIEVLSVKEPEEDKTVATVDISFFTKDIQRAAGGLPLRDREQLRLLVPSDFPFKTPSVWTRHQRFAAFPHVQWGRSLCLYQAEVEWNPSDGMYGFLARLDEWLKFGARNELDPQGAPLHPPVAYSVSSARVIPRVDTPSVTDTYWYGSAHLAIVGDSRVEITGWSDFLAKDTPSSVAAAILLADPYNFSEFPTKVRTLLKLLESQGVSRERLLLTLQAATVYNKEKTSLYVIIGTPMRGIQGMLRQQHLTAWRIVPELADSFRSTIGLRTDNFEIRRLRSGLEELIWKWAEDAPIEWCNVLEDRPEVTRRRDHSSPASWFQDREIELWGCGALGGYVAEYLVRAGARKLILRDEKTVTPGILARQAFDDSDIGMNKAEALSKRLRRIQPDERKLELEEHSGDILLDPLEHDRVAATVDIVVNATASSRVEKKLERKLASTAGLAAPIISMMVGHQAERGFVVLIQPEHSGGPIDACRKTKISLLREEVDSAYLDDFWPSTEQRRERLFQPEPGCSDATFVGSAADLATLAGVMLNLAAVDLADSSEATASAHLVTQPHVSTEIQNQTLVSFSWSADRIHNDPIHNYEVRLSPESQGAISRWIKRSGRRRGPDVETGGLLFGERDDAAKVVWVDKVSGPPIDSEASATYFLCGTVGTKELAAKHEEKSCGSTRYLGMWHTHPNGALEPSDIDFMGMSRLLRDQTHSLLLILRGQEEDLTGNAFVFTRRDLRDVGLLDAPRLRLSTRIRTRAYLAALPIRLAMGIGEGGWYYSLLRLLRRSRN